MFSDLRMALQAYDSALILSRPNADASFVFVSASFLIFRSETSLLGVSRCTIQQMGISSLFPASIRI